jgi:hypothetical protein
MNVTLGQRRLRRSHGPARTLRVGTARRAAAFTMQACEFDSGWSMTQAET